MKQTYLQAVDLVLEGKSDKVEDAEMLSAIEASFKKRTAFEKTKAAEAEKVEARDGKAKAALKSLWNHMFGGEPEPEGAKEPKGKSPAPQEPKYTPPPVPVGAGPTGLAFPNTFRAVAEAAASLKVDQAVLGVAMVTHGDEGPAAVLAAVYAKAAEANKAVPPSSQTNGPSGSGLSQEEDSLLASIKAVAAQHAPK